MAYKHEKLGFNLLSNIFVIFEHSYKHCKVLNSKINHQTLLIFSRLSERSIDAQISVWKRTSKLALKV